MKRIALRWLGALLLSITLAAPALAAGKHLINGIDANYPPFAYVDETGKPAGFDVDSMNWIAKKMGFTVEHKPMDWDGIIPALLAKKIDMVCSGMSISPERKAQANFSDPYWTIRKIFITKKGSKVTEDQIYNGKIKLGVQRGTNEHEMLQKAQAEKKYNYQLRFYDSGPMAIEDLLNGRIDAIGLAAAGGAIAIGMAVAKSVEGIARQPEAESKIRTTLMLGLVFIETAIIYALLVVILIIFVL